VHFLVLVKNVQIVIRDSYSFIASLLENGTIPYEIYRYGIDHLCVLAASDRRLGMLLLSLAEAPRGAFSFHIFDEVVSDYGRLSAPEACHVAPFELLHAAPPLIRLATVRLLVKLGVS